VLLTVAIVVAVGIAALIVFTDQDSTAQSIAVVAAVIAPSVAGLGLLWYHGRSNH
jgi:protein-S-isoprenylcysteine O-methyltransferase Ste14